MRAASIAGAFPLFRTIAYSALACLAAIAGCEAQLAPGYGYATDTDNRIVSVDLATGETSFYNGQTIFPANALGYADANGAAGSVIYSSNTTAGELGVWNRFTNIHTDIGNITSTTSGFTNPYPAGAALSDAAYWDGSSGPPAGYYVVSPNRTVYRVDFHIDSTDRSIVSIANVTLVATIPVATTTTNLTATFGFGDIAFNPANGVLYLSDSNNGLFDYTIGATTATKISTRYDGQLAFGQDDLLYGVGNSAGVPNTQGNDFYRISLTDGTLVAGSVVLNTDVGFTFRDFSGAAAIDIVPEPGTPGLILFVFGLALGTAFWRRRAKSSPPLS